MRRGRDEYAGKYDEVILLHKNGMPIKDIAKKLNISYSAAYHWIKGLRKPEKGNLISFREFLEKEGPTAAIEIKEKFPKHNELFLTATRRSFPLKRLVLPRKYGEYNTWYFVAGSEEKLKERVRLFLVRHREAREKIAEVLEGLFRN